MFSQGRLSIVYIFVSVIHLWCDKRQTWWLYFFNSPEYWVYISQPIRYSKTCAQYSDFLGRAQLLTQKLLKQGYVAPKLKSSLQKLHGRHQDLVTKYPYLNGSFTLYVDASFLFHCHDFYRAWLYIWVTPLVSYKTKELLILREFTLAFLVRVAHLFLVFCVVLLFVFMLWVPCCVCYDFRIQTMFGLSLPPVACRRARVLLTL